MGPTGCGAHGLNIKYRQHEEPSIVIVMHGHMVKVNLDSTIHMLLPPG